MDKLQIAGSLDGLQQKIIEDGLRKQQNKKSKYNFDKLAMFFGEEYEVKGIKISIPTIGDILKVGEENFYHSLFPFLYNSTSIRVSLWDIGKDWCEIKDIEVFSLLSSVQPPNNEALRLVFKNNDMLDFKLIKIPNKNNNDSDCFLVSEKQQIILTEDEYMMIAEYIREMLNIHPKIEKAKGKTAKRWMIDEDKLNALQKSEEKNTSSLLPLISACINHPGFKYKLQELREVGICQFMDAVQRLQLYESTRALWSGRFSGFCDLSNVDQNEFNFMKSLS